MPPDGCQQPHPLHKQHLMLDAEDQRRWRYGEICLLPIANRSVKPGSAVLCAGRLCHLLHLPSFAVFAPSLPVGQKVSPAALHETHKLQWPSSQGAWTSHAAPQASMQTNVMIEGLFLPTTLGGLHFDTPTYGHPHVHGMGQSRPSGEWGTGLVMMLLLHGPSRSEEVRGQALLFEQGRLSTTTGPLLRATTDSGEWGSGER